jgi:parallel beta-helix repeat protein
LKGEVSNRIFSAILVSLLLIGILTLAFNIQPVKAQPTTITVPDDYPTIQGAINAANDGDTVLVYSGTYYETVITTKRLTLKGIDYPIVDAQRQSSPITITVANCVVDGFKVTQGLKSDGEGGITVVYYSGGGNVIKNNIAYNNTIGIYVQKTADNSIVNNTAYFNDYAGIECWVEQNDYLANNTIFPNGYEGILLSSASHMTVEGNLVYSNAPEAGIMLDGCDDSLVSRNIIFENNFGIDIDYSGSGNVIIENNVTANYWGVRWYSRIGKNLFYHNNFINNTYQAYYYDVPTGPSARNTWDDGYPSGGNYCSDYNGTDLYSGPNQNETGSDGIGDTPYVIDANNLDNYPLMSPWISIVGDVNGDGKVNLEDLVTLAMAYGSKVGDTNWNSNADIDGNGIVGLSDLVILAQHYGQHYP